MVTVGAGITGFAVLTYVIGISINRCRAHLLPLSKRYPFIDAIVSLFPMLLCVCMVLIPDLDLNCSVWLVLAWIVVIGSCPLLVQMVFVYTDFLIRDDLVHSGMSDIPESTRKLIHLRKRLSWKVIIIVVNVMTFVTLGLLIITYNSAKDFFDQKVMQDSCTFGHISPFSLMAIFSIPCIILILNVRKKLIRVKESFYIKKTYVMLMYNLVPCSFLAALNDVFGSSPEIMRYLIYLLGISLCLCSFVILYYPIYLSYTVFKTRNLELLTHSTVSIGQNKTFFSFEDIVSDVILLSDLKDFMTAEFSVENLLFIITIDECIKLCSEHNTEEIRSHLQKLKFMYLDENGVMCINLSSYARDDANLCIDQLENCDEIREEDLVGLLQARRAIIDLIVCSVLPRFALKRGIEEHHP